MIFVPISPILRESTCQEYYSLIISSLGDIFFYRDIQYLNLLFSIKNKIQPKRRKNERKKESTDTQHQTCSSSLAFIRNQYGVRTGNEFSL